MSMRPWIAALLIAVPLTACEGPAGEIGPTGPPGPQGPVGPAGQDAQVEVYMQTGTVTSSSGVTASFPGVWMDEAVVNCWVGEGGTWLKVGTDVSAELSCGAEQNGSTLRVAIIGTPTGWQWMVVVVDLVP